VAPLLTKIAKLDVKRLSKSKAAAAAAAAKQSAEAEVAGSAGQGGAGGGQQPGGVKRNDAGTVSAARERYLQRKGSSSVAGPVKKK
jgi:hypothetical protein